MFSYLDVISDFVQFTENEWSVSDSTPRVELVKTRDLFVQEAARRCWRIDVRTEEFASIAIFSDSQFIFKQDELKGALLSFVEPKHNRIRQGKQRASDENRIIIEHMVKVVRAWQWQ